MRWNHFKPKQMKRFISRVYRESGAGERTVHVIYEASDGLTVIYIIYEVPCLGGALQLLQHLINNSLYILYFQYTYF